MEPPAPQLSAASGAAIPTPYTDSVDSSPRSRNTDSWDEPLPPIPGGSKLRLMCSYGGHIVPRPHDKSLCYVGGDTRIVVAERQSSLADLSSRLSKTLLHDRPFTLKYQLPNEDLDSLISVTTDEDLDNMIEEYDRISSSGSSTTKSSRLRLFLFPSKPDSGSSMGSILDNSIKSDDWFLDALNGSGVLSSGFSDSTTTVNCLLGLDNDDIGINNNNCLGSRDLDGSQPEFEFNGSKNVKQSGQDVHSIPDSPMLDTTSSFGSASSSPLLANLPPIRVHVEDGSNTGGGGGGGVRVQDQKVGIEEQFAQLNVAASAPQKHDDGFVVLSSPPPIPTTITGVSPVTNTGEYHRVFSDDERSDHGVPVGYRKPPQPQTLALPQTLPPQSQHKPTGGIDLPSPDSVSSDSSITNAISRTKSPMIYQEPIVQIPPGNNRVSPNPVDQKISIADQITRLQMQQAAQESGYILQSQLEQQQQQQQQQQFIQAGAHYIHHHPQGQVPLSSYYPVYPSQQQQQQQPHHPQLDQQYPVYYMPTRQPQAYNMSMQQSNFSEPPTSYPSSRPQTPPTPVMIPPQAPYNPARNAPPPKHEMTAGVYRTATTNAPQLVQVSSNQLQQQYVGYPQMHHPSQSMAPNSATTANYAYEYADPTHGQQVYYAPTMPAQYQTMTSAPAVVLPEASAQLPTDNMKQQMRT